MEEKRINKNIVFSIIAVVLLIVAVVGATYAYFSATASTEQQTVTTGTLTMGFTNGEILRATGITPIADSEIKTKATELPFSVTNTGSEHMNLTISLTDITISEELKDIDFRWGLYNADTGNGLSFGIFKDLGTETSMVIYRDTIIDAADPDITNNYILRVWIHDDGALQNYMQGKNFSAKVTVDGEAVEYTPEECFLFNKNTGELVSELYEWDETTGSEEIISSGGYKDTCPKDVVIPKTIGGVTVTSIGYNVFSDMGITSVVVPNTVTTLDGLSSSGLTHVTIPESVTVIGSSALGGNNLTHVAIPESVTRVYAGSFYSDNLIHITIPGSVALDDAVFNSTVLTSIVLMEGIQNIPMGIFAGSNLTEIELPSSVDNVYEGAFEGNTNLTKIIVRGKTSLADFTDSVGLTTEGGLPEGVTIEFRP